MPLLQDYDYIEPEFKEVLETLPDDETFIIGRCNEEHAATTLCCKKCKNTDFKVGKSSYYTVVKCTNCDWQVCVHEG